MCYQRNAPPCRKSRDDIRDCLRQFLWKRKWCHNMAFFPRLLSFFRHGGVPCSPLEFHPSCYRPHSHTTKVPFVPGDSERSAERWRCWAPSSGVCDEPSHRKLVLSVMLGEDLAVLRVAELALLALAFRLSWFPLTAASRRDFRWGDDAMRDLRGGIYTLFQF